MYKIFAFIILAIFLFVAAAFVISGKITAHYFSFVLLSVLAGLAVFVKAHTKYRMAFLDDAAQYQGQINLLTESISQQRKKMQLFPSRRDRVSFLFELSQKMIGLEDPEEIMDFLVDTAMGLFPQADTILFFSLQREKNTLSLTRSRKKEQKVVKEKKGDILDTWVVRHNKSLVIEDITKEFRFDYNKVIASQDRNARSFIASPISIGEKVLGLVRVDSSQATAFSLDDSRLLLSICDFGAMVLERAYMVKNTEELAIRDSLTSLYLKDYFFHRLKEEMVRTNRKNAGLGIAVLDIDDFKKVNDTYGHVVGDRVLKRLAKILTETVGDSGNVVSRFGGEEFIFSLVECEKKKLIDICETVRKKTEQAVVGFRRQKVGFTVSLGAVFYPEDGQDMLELIDKADHRLYSAKKSGKNRVCYQDPKLLGGRS